MKLTQRMRYDHQNDRWHIYGNSLEYDLHCGDCFEILIDGIAIQCRLELQHDWYIILGDISFYLRKSEQFLIRL